jgi:hypothetical protein
MRRMIPPLDSRPMPPTGLNRFLGGAPAVVAVRLLVVSLVVGALLVWLDIDPLSIVDAVERLGQHVWGMGFEAVRELGRYLAAGALIVVPVWFLARLFSVGASR